MLPGSSKYTDIPLGLIGSNKFGQSPFMSSEQTFNMSVSDGYYVNFSGYKRVVQINSDGVGRGIYASQKLNKMFAVIDDGIYSFDSALTPSRIATIPSTNGDVFIAENNNPSSPTPMAGFYGGEVAFSDSENLYVYRNEPVPEVKQLISGSGAGLLNFRPGYLTYQNGRFVSPDLNSNQFRLSKPNQASDILDWPSTAQHVGAVQTKPNKCVACIRFPGLGNLLYVFGATVTEPWQDIGAQLFPYQRSSSSNIDYGCLNPATIAESENIVCWLGINEKSGPTIMYSNGRDVSHLSTDGIDYKLGQLTRPANSYAFMFKQYGHLFYVITFPDDGLTYAYDWNTQGFYTLTDERMSYFIAKRVAFFNGQYYFVSINDGNLYQLGPQFTDYDYGDGRNYEIPRIRICPEIKQPDQSRFIAGYAGFKIESGNSTTTQSVDIAVSKDSGVSFSSLEAKVLPTIGRRTNRLMWWQLGAANTLTHQFQFHGFDRFTMTEGICGIYQ